MATKASAQATLIDLTDAYTVVLTNESHTWSGTTSAVSGSQTITTQVIAYQGSNKVSCSVDTGAIEMPSSGISVTSDSATPWPTLTVAANSSLTSAGSFTIPVTITDSSTGDTVTIYKEFSYSIAFKGATGEAGSSVSVTSTKVTYQAGTNGTTAPTGTWSESVPNVSNGQYLWTKTEVTYTTTTASGSTSTDTTTSYSVAYIGTDGDAGTSITNVSSKITYQASDDGSTAPTGTWYETVAAAGAAQGQFLWTRTTVTYTLTDAAGSTTTKTTTSDAVAYIGIDGINGADAITLSIESSNGFFFKNTAIATTLTAHVYQSGAELTATQIAALGTIKWYKDGGTTAVATGVSITISAGDVSNVASYIAQLES